MRPCAAASGAERCVRWVSPTLPLRTICPTLREASPLADRASGRSPVAGDSAGVGSPRGLASHRGQPCSVCTGSFGAAARPAGVGCRDAAVKPTGRYSRRPAGWDTAAKPGTGAGTPGRPPSISAGSFGAVARPAGVGRRDAAVKPTGRYSRRPAGRDTAAKPGTGAGTPGRPPSISAGSFGAAARPAGVGRRDAAVKPTGTYSRRPAGRDTAAKPGTSARTPGKRLSAGSGRAVWRFWVKMRND